MPYETLLTRANGYVVDATIDYNKIIGAVNASVQMWQETVAALDVNSSIVLATPGASVVLLDGIGAVNVNGCAVPPRNPYFMTIINITSDVATLKHESLTEPTPAKRLILPNNADLSLSLGQGCTFVYVSVPLGARWLSVVSA